MEMHREGTSDSHIQLFRLNEKVFSSFDFVRISEDRAVRMPETLNYVVSK